MRGNFQLQPAAATGASTPISRPRAVDVDPGVDIATGKPHPHEWPARQRFAGGVASGSLDKSRFSPNMPRKYRSQGVGSKSDSSGFFG